MKAGVWREEWRRNIQQLSHLLLAPLHGHQDDELMMLMKLTTFPIEIQYLPKIQIVLMALYLHRDIVEILLNDMNCSLKIWSVFDSNTERNRLTNHKIKQLQTASDTKCVSFQCLSIRKDLSIRFGACLFKNHSAVQSFYFIHLWFWCLKCNGNLELKCRNVLFFVKYLSDSWIERWLSQLRSL